MKIKLSDLQICEREQERFKRLFGNAVTVNKENLFRFTKSRCAGQVRPDNLADTVYDYLYYATQKYSAANVWLYEFEWRDQTEKAIIGAGLEAIKTGRVTKTMLKRHGIELHL